jgi:serine protease Do
MGVQLQSVTPDIANSLGMKEARGAIIDEPQPDSPAAKAGMQAGDVITALNGVPVKDSHDLARKVGMLAPATSAKFDVVRSGQSTTVTLTLGERPSEQQAKAKQQGSSSNPAGVAHLGLSLARAGDVAGSANTGLVVTGVEPNAPAAEAGVQTGDVILDVEGKAVTNISEVRKALSDAKAQGKHSILMRLKKADATRFVAIPLGTG